MKTKNENPTEVLKNWFSCFESLMLRQAQQIGKSPINASNPRFILRPSKGERCAFQQPTRALTLAIALTWVILTVTAFNTGVALGASAGEIDRNATQSLTTLYKNTPGTKALADKAVAVLVFPSIVKGGFIIAGQFGDGALRKSGKSVAYYRSLAASYGFQAGVQAFGYVLFFMDDASVQYLDNSAGWELGTGPSLVVLDAGFGKTLSTTTLQKGVYAFIFDQKGLMGGLGIQGSKITRINPNP